MPKIKQKSNRFKQIDSEMEEKAGAVDEVPAETEKMKELVESLIGKAKPEEQVELRMLYNAMVTNANSYQANPTSKNLKDWNVAKDALASAVEKLQGKYESEDSSADFPDDFSEQKSVLAYLHGRGYQISKSGLSKHFREGKLQKDTKTGKFLREKVDAYAKAHLVLAATGKKEGEQADVLQLRKLEAETREREAKAEMAEYDLNIKKGKYIDREDMVRELVSRSLILDSSLRHMVKTAAPEFIELAGGRMDKLELVIDEMMQIVDQVMNSFASTEDFVVDLVLEEQEEQHAQEN